MHSRIHIHVHIHIQLHIIEDVLLDTCKHEMRESPTMLPPSGPLGDAVGAAQCDSVHQSTLVQKCYILSYHLVQTGDACTVGVIKVTGGIFLRFPSTLSVFVSLPQSVFEFHGPCLAPEHVDPTACSDLLQGERRELNAHQQCQMKTVQCQQMELASA